MALNVGDVVQLTDVQTYLGQQVLNVYFYQLEAVDPDVTLEMIAQAFDLFVITPILDMQSDALLHSQVLIKNLTDGVGIWEEPVNRPGAALGGGSLASFYAYGFRLVRTDASTRHGSKRLAGALEAHVEGNSVTPAMLPALDAVAAGMAMNLLAEGTVADFVARPVIVGRYPLGNPLVGQLDLSKINPVSSVQFIRVTTQTTRRAGRGS